MTLPSLSTAGKVIFITPSFPPNPAAASVVHYNMLKGFDPESFLLLVAKFIGLPRRFEVPEKFHIRYIFYSFEFISAKIQLVLDSLLQFIAYQKALSIAREYQPAFIVASYPNLHFLNLGRKLAAKLSIPFIPYLHDTVAESLAHTVLAREALDVQQNCFKQAHQVAVISKGMAKLYQRKYGLDTSVWPHQFPETDFVPVPWEQKKLQAFWAGDVYAINGKSLKRVSDVLGSMGIPLLVSGPKSPKLLAREMQISGSHVKQVYAPKRDDYLRSMSESKILIICLDWPDESVVHEDELATIFPTKTMEYLHSGSLILLHCPEHYYLNTCLHSLKQVINIYSKSSDEISSALLKIAENKTAPDMTSTVLANINNNFKQPLIQ